MKKQLMRILLRTRRFIGYERELRGEFKRVILTIQVILLAIVACITFAILDIAQGFYISALIDGSAILVFSLAIYLIRIYGYLSIGKTILIVYSCFSMIVNASRDGRFAGNEYIWFPIVCGIFLFFSIRERQYMVFCILVALCSILFMEITNYSFLLRPVDMLKYKHINYIICLSVSLILVCIYMYYLIKVNADSERRLEKLNKTLLRRNENLKKINSELDSFVYKASHDMRAPLTSLLGLIEISKRETDPVALNAFLELQAKSIRKLDSYIVDILNISRNARMEIKYVPVNFRDSIQQIFEQLDYLENSFRVKRNIIVYDTVPFMTDGIRLNIILSNLISNSIRYADLSKEEPVINIKVRVNIDSAEITISDNGMGISEKHMSRVFDMFYRGTEINNGSGLGLYIVKETLQKMKGHINIKSEEGKFTEIVIVLPNQKKEVSN